MADQNFEKNLWINDDDEEECSFDVDSPKSTSNVKPPVKEIEPIIQTDRTEDGPWMLKFNKACLKKFIDQESYGQLSNYEKFWTNETSLESTDSTYDVPKIEEELDINDFHSNEEDCIDGELSAKNDVVLHDVESHKSALHKIPNLMDVSYDPEILNTLNERHDKREEDPIGRHKEKTSNSHKIPTGEFETSKPNSVTDKENFPSKNPIKRDKIKNKQKESPLKKQFENCKKRVQEQYARNKQVEDSNKQKWKNTVLHNAAKSSSKETSSVKTAKQLEVKTNEYKVISKNVKGTIIPNLIITKNGREGEEKKKKLHKSRKPEISKDNLVENNSKQLISGNSSNGHAIIEQNNENKLKTYVNSDKSVKTAVQGVLSSSSVTTKDASDTKRKRKRKRLDFDGIDNKNDSKTEDPKKFRLSVVSKSNTDVITDKSVQSPKASKKRKLDVKDQMEEKLPTKKRKKKHKKKSLMQLASMIESNLKENVTESPSKELPCSKGDKSTVTRTEPDCSIKLSTLRRNSNEITSQVSPIIDKLSNNTPSSNEQFSISKMLENCGLDASLINTNKETSMSSDQESLLNNSNESGSVPGLEQSLVNKCVTNVMVTEENDKQNNSNLTNTTLSEFLPNVLPTSISSKQTVTVNHSSDNTRIDKNSRNPKSRVKYTPQNSLFSIQNKLNKMQTFNNLIDELDLAKSPNSSFVKDLFKNWIKQSGFSLIQDVQNFKNSCKNKDPLEELGKLVSIPKMEISLLLKLCDVAINDDVEVSEEKNIFIIPPPILEILKDIPRLCPSLQSYVTSRYEQSKCFLSPKAIKDLNSALTVATSSKQLLETNMISVETFNSNTYSNKDISLSKSPHSTNQLFSMTDVVTPKVSENHQILPLKMNTCVPTKSQQKTSVGGNASLSQTFNPPSPACAQIGGIQTSPRRSSHAQMESLSDYSTTINIVEGTNSSTTVVASNATQIASSRNISTLANMPLLTTPPLVTIDNSQTVAVTSSAPKAKVPSNAPVLSPKKNKKGPVTPLARTKSNWQNGLNERRQISKRTIKSKSEVATPVSKSTVIHNNVKSPALNHNLTRPNPGNSRNAGTSTSEDSNFVGLYLQTPQGTINPVNAEKSGIYNITMSLNSAPFVQSEPGFQRQLMSVTTGTRPNFEKQPNVSLNSEHTTLPNLSSFEVGGFPDSLPDIGVLDIDSILEPDQTPNLIRDVATQNNYFSMSSNNGIAHNTAVNASINHVPSTPQICVRDLSELRGVNALVPSRKITSSNLSGKESQGAWHRPFTPS